MIHYNILMSTACVNKVYFSLKCSLTYTSLIAVGKFISAFNPITQLLGAHRAVCSDVTVVGVPQGNVKKNRTSDLPIMGPPLYLLSYLPRTHVLIIKYKYSFLVKGAKSGASVLRFYVKSNVVKMIAALSLCRSINITITTRTKQMQQSTRKAKICCTLYRNKVTFVPLLCDSCSL